MTWVETYPDDARCTFWKPDRCPDPTVAVGSAGVWDHTKGVDAEDEGQKTAGKAGVLVSELRFETDSWRSVRQARRRTTGVICEGK